MVILSCAVTPEHVISMLAAVSTNISGHAMRRDNRAKTIGP